MTEAELGWAAGLFEGEGSVRINSHTNRNRGALLVDVANCDPIVTEFFRERWGGTVKLIAGTGTRTRRECYRWRAASRQAGAFLSAILPYLRTDVYRERAELGLEYQAQKSMDQRVSRTPDYAARQNDYYRRMATLNLRGAAAVEHRRAEPRRDPSGRGRVPTRKAAE